VKVIGRAVFVSTQSQRASSKAGTAASRVWAFEFCLRSILFVGVGLSLRTTRKASGCTICISLGVGSREASVRNPKNADLGIQTEKNERSLKRWLAR